MKPFICNTYKDIEDAVAKGINVYIHPALQDRLSDNNFHVIPNTLIRYNPIKQLLLMYLYKDNEGIIYTIKYVVTEPFEIVLSEPIDRKTDIDGTTGDESTKPWMPYATFTASIARRNYLEQQALGIRMYEMYNKTKDAISNNIKFTITNTEAEQKTIDTIKDIGKDLEQRDINAIYSAFYGAPWNAIPKSPNDLYLASQVHKALKEGIYKYCPYCGSNTNDHSIGCKINIIIEHLR